MFDSGQMVIVRLLHCKVAIATVRCQRCPQLLGAPEHTSRNDFVEILRRFGGGSPLTENRRGVA